ncbi:UDP-glucose 4-epimerase protein [Marine Group I thaumarchaeote SCGC AAA799-B03]|uniref:UDP-glucose 4-epimerase protein n=1 Tax=Marine Group I thaumarchaeote SCGC AAA799-B03 TaxID=1502289 RepID=A0A087S907_9ARCH|nr:UDP-glucose 4-epimerase protein [Marine Group I thaumarchaeote SCGC AAA799-B03]
MNILITGSDGFIGNSIVKEYQKNNHTVFQLSRKHDGENIIKGDICTTTYFDNIPDIELIIHCAAYTDTRQISADQQKFFNTNCLGTANILNLTKEKQADLIYVSSCDVYGIPEYLPIDENHICNPITTYAASKSAAEQMCIGFCQQNKLKLKIVRPFNTFGPKSPEYRVIPTIIRQLKHNESIKIANTTSKRDFIFVDDVANAIYYISKSKNDSKIFNIGTGRTLSILEVIKMLEKILNKKVPIESPERLGPIPELQADISKLKEIGWTSRYNFETGLKEILNAN